MSPVVLAQDQVFQHLRDEVKRRRTQGQIPVQRSDGQASLEQDRKACLPRDRKTVNILDLTLGRVEGHRMHYGRYLRAGPPIATGVIEAACRHVIRDRMERAGMRWKVAGAEAMLELRTFETIRVSVPRT